nr:putative reverse transcriptase domain-containing protein [Tanacetum cinerariifolium]
FKVLERVRDISYKLDLPEELSRVHNTFHVSNLRNCHDNKPLAVPLDGLHVDDKLYFVEEPVEIMDHEIEAKFAQVWKRIEDFTPMGSNEEAERGKRKGIILEKEQVKKQKSSEEALESKTPTEEVSEDKIKEMMQLVPIEDVYVQAL